MEVFVIIANVSKVSQDPKVHLHAITIFSCIDHIFLYSSLQASDELKYLKMSISDRSKQLLELHARMEENISVETANKKAFEDELQTSLNVIIASDDSRRAVLQFAHEEDQQNVAVCSFLFHGTQFFTHQGLIASILWEKY